MLEALLILFFHLTGCWVITECCHMYEAQQQSWINSFSMAFAESEKLRQELKVVKEQAENYRQTSILRSLKDNIPLVPVETSGRIYPLDHQRAFRVDVQFKVDRSVMITNREVLDLRPEYQEDFCMHWAEELFRGVTNSIPSVAKELRHALFRR